MKLLLTDALSGKQMMVESELIRLVEPIDAGGSHIVFSEAQGRQVKESFESIVGATGAVTPAAAITAALTPKMPVKKK